MEDVKRIYRSRTDVMLSGVSAGIAKYFNLDPVLIRIIWAVAIVSSVGGAFLIYLLCWFLIPREPESPLGGE